MSTPPDTETFVSGDRVTYTYQGKVYTGTIIEPFEPYSTYGLEGWYKIDLSEGGYGVCILPGNRMEKIEPSKVEKPSSAEIKSKLVSSLEDQIENWQSFMVIDGQLAEMTGRESDVAEVQSAFDAGYLAGLRKAIQLTQKLAD